MTSRLFDTLTFPTPSKEGLTTRNRVFVAPMCMYSADGEDGLPTAWHFQHYGALAAGGFGLVVVEATGVEARGRITPRDLGIWDDNQISAHAEIVDLIHSQGALAGIQLAHAGGKASTNPGLPGFTNESVPLDEGGWETISATEGPVMPEYAAARSASPTDLQTVVRSFAEAARRADKAGYDIIQIHGAHGYLLHQFLSPLTNERSDEYGNDEQGRTKLLREVMAEVRRAWPDGKPLGLRISATDWVPGGWDVEASIRLAKELVEENNVDWIDVSTGGLGRGAKVAVGPGYQVPCAAQIKAALSDTGVPVSAVGVIDNAAQADTVVRTALADAVSIGRAALRNPHWATQALANLRIPTEGLPFPPQYWRARW